jgi:hypothetical protein
VHGDVNGKGHHGSHLRSNEAHHFGSAFGWSLGHRIRHTGIME